MHIHADEQEWRGCFNAYLDGVLMDAVVEAEDGPRGFVFVDPTFWCPAPRSLNYEADWEADESDPGPAWVLFGAVVLEPIP